LGERIESREWRVGRVLSEIKTPLDRCFDQGDKGSVSSAYGQGLTLMIPKYWRMRRREKIVITKRVP
jgi:hypothetical protein